MKMTPDHFEYHTGRTYDMAQVLIITVEKQTTDDFDITEIIATFVDESRHISGRVCTVVFGRESIGEAVLAAYDAGNYSLL